jgi:glycosyltransferase involved in cell wall biosynthesis
VSEPLRVALDMTFPNRNAAGSNVYATELVRELQHREGLSVTEVVGGTGLSGTVRWLAGGARVPVASAQIVHCPAFVAPWRMRKPFVLTVHDTSIFDFPEDHAFEWRSYIRMFLARQARAATRVITGTENSRREIAQDLQVPADRIAVTPYGVSERYTRARVGHPELSAGKRSDVPELLFPGAPSRRKNLDLVIRAMSEAPPGSAMRRARLAISGARGEDFPVYRKRINALGLEHRVDWRGQVPIEQMPDLLGASDAIVYPSLQEGFGFPALEAMSLGVPVIASNASCLPEVLGDGALLVDPTDVKAFIGAAEAILGRPEVRHDLVAKGKARASQFTWRRCADLTIEVYKDALASGSEPGRASR